LIVELTAGSKEAADGLVVGVGRGRVPPDGNEIKESIV
jgi:hypothetical protein